MNRNKIRTGVVALAVGAVLGVSGIAFAWFSETTSNINSSAAAAEMAPLTTGTPTVLYGAGTTKLWPGHPASVQFTVNNSNEVAVKVVKVELTSLTVPTGCSADLVILGDPIPSPFLPTQAAGTFWTGPVPVPARITEDGTATITINQAIAISTTSTTPEPGCQNASIGTTWRVTAENA